jgi:hypothetical protein
MKELEVIEAALNLATQKGAFNLQDTASLSNIARFSTESVSPFVPYEDLINEIVIGWIQDELGVDGVSNLEACIQGQIDSQINPPVTPQNTPLPWAPAPVEA